MKANFPIEQFRKLETPFYYYDTNLLRETLNKIKEEAGKYKEEYDNKLKNVKAETDEIMSAARVKAKKQEAQIVDEAKEEAARIIKRAENEAVLEKGKAKDEMKQEIIAVASLMAEKIVESSMTEEEQNKMLEAALNEMGEETWQN